MWVLNILAHSVESKEKKKKKKSYIREERNEMTILIKRITLNKSERKEIKWWGTGTV